MCQSENKCLLTSSIFLIFGWKHQQKGGTQLLMKNEEGERLLWFYQIGPSKCLCANEGGELSLKDISENLWETKA
jgi:hypothetical protein